MGYLLTSEPAPFRMSCTLSSMSGNFSVAPFLAPRIISLRLVCGTPTFVALAMSLNRILYPWLEKSLTIVSYASPSFADISPGTFSNAKNLGSADFTARTYSMYSLPLLTSAFFFTLEAGLIPDLLPPLVIEKSWHGGPPIMQSTFPIGEKSMLVTSPTTYAGSFVPFPNSLASTILWEKFFE